RLSAALSLVGRHRQRHGLRLLALEKAVWLSRVRVGERHTRTDACARGRSHVPDSVVEPRPNDVRADIEGDRAAAAGQIAAETVEVRVEILDLGPPWARDHELDAETG